MPFEEMSNSSAIAVTFLCLSTSPRPQNSTYGSRQVMSFMMTQVSRSGMDLVVIGAPELW